MTAQLHSAFEGQWHVATHLARNSGDFRVTELLQDPSESKRALELTRTLFSVKTKDTQWTADSDVACTRLGEPTGHWLAEAPSPASLPTAASPLGGSLKAHVQDLNVSGAWLPHGCRPAGAWVATCAPTSRCRAAGDLQRAGGRIRLAGERASEGRGANVRGECAVWLWGTNTAMTL